MVAVAQGMANVVRAGRKIIGWNRTQGLARGEKVAKEIKETWLEGLAENQPTFSQGKR